jgi:hypothetical protein
MRSSWRQSNVISSSSLDHPRTTSKKILEAAYPHHPYPVKHKLRDYTMMKRFISFGAPPGGDERVSDPRGTTLEEANVTTITG